MINSKFKIHNSQFNRGQIALPLVLIIISTLIFIGVTIASIVALGSSQVKRSTESQAALFLAKAGIDDALLKITYNYTYAQSSQSYNLNFSYGSIAVTITPNVPQTGQTQITSIGTASGILGIQRKLVAVISVDSNGQITLISLAEQTI